MNRYSLKKIREINEETPIRIILALRADGTPLITPQTIYRNGLKFVLNRVVCTDGICEKCGSRKPALGPHEKHSRGRGGKLTATNTIMLCRDCHNTEQRNYPMWSGNG